MPTWIKGKDRLPDDNKSYPVRWTSMNGQKDNLILTTRTRIEELMRHEVDLDVEWLDESPSPSLEGQPMTISFENFGASLKADSPDEDSEISISLEHDENWLSYSLSLEEAEKLANFLHYHIVNERHANHSDVENAAPPATQPGDVVKQYLVDFHRWANTYGWTYGIMGCWNNATTENKEVRSITKSTNQLYDLYLQSLPAPKTDNSQHKKESI